MFHESNLNIRMRKIKIVEKQTQPCTVNGIGARYCWMFGVGVFQLNHHVVRDISWMLTVELIRSRKGVSALERLWFYYSLDFEGNSRRSTSQILFEAQFWQKIVTQRVTWIFHLFFSCIKRRGSGSRPSIFKKVSASTAALPYASIWRVWPFFFSKELLRRNGLS